MRVFEALSCGSLLVTDKAGNGLAELFGDQEHLALYDDESVEDVIERSLEDSLAREEIAARGQRLVIQHHTYARRMQELVAHTEGAKRFQTIAH
jgi:spore maturation protein CgeB